MRTPGYSQLTADVFDAALRRGPMTRRQIEQRFSVSKPTVREHLRRLRAAGVLVELGEGQDREYVIVQKAVAS